MKDKPDYCYSSGCPLANKGRGFSLGTGDPSTAKMAILFERPAEDEINFTFGGPKPPQVSQQVWDERLAWQKEEIARRKAAFPELDVPEQRRFIARGAPVRGMSGAELRTWAGLNLEEHVLENVLHCAAGKDHEYPKSDERTAAEACCAHWSRLGISAAVPRDQSFLPEAAIVSLHPAGLLRDTGGGIVALPLQLDTFTKARSFLRQGLVGRVLVLAGGVASKYWNGYAESVTKWCGHYFKETEQTWQKRRERIAKGLAVVPLLVDGKKPKRERKKPSLAEDLGIPKKERKPRSRKKAEPIPGMQSMGM